MACTLSDDDARVQLEQWRTLSARAIIQRVRSSPVRLELLLDPRLNDVAELVQLAQREKRCCSFFTFNFAVDEERVTLVIDVPEAAAALLDDFETHLL